MAIETHEFDVDRSIIIHLIESQAGTLGKAVLESVMNSVDAGATQVSIEVDRSHVVIADDGHGLRTRDEILAVFKRFGFDHSKHKREFGRFGLGRGQLWNWARSRWYSHSFALDVDVRERGLKWELEDERPHVDGLRIEAEFYEPLTALELAQLHNQMESLCRYTAVPVIFNGKRLGKDPAGQKWDCESEEAYIKVTDAQYLSIYNQGVHVADLYRGTVGLGGTIVTKRGHALELNMARNDILRAKCTVWKKIKGLIDELAGKESSRSTRRITEADRDYLARETVDPSKGANFSKPILSLADGKHLTFEQFARRAQGARVISVAETGNRIAEVLIRERKAVVLSPVTLARFGADNVHEFVQTLVARVEASVANQQWECRYLRDSVKVYERIEDCPGYSSLTAQRIPDSELPKATQQLICAMREHQYALVHRLREHTGSDMKARELFIGRGNVEAYTNGQSYIGIVDATAEAALRDGLAGFLRLAHLLVHEYLHATDDTGSHAHDVEFMTSFHDFILDKHTALFQFATSVFKDFCKRQARLTQSRARSLDLLDKDQVSVDAA